MLSKEGSRVPQLRPDSAKKKKSWLPFTFFALLMTQSMNQGLFGLTLTVMKATCVGKIGNKTEGIGSPGTDPHLTVHLPLDCQNREK